MDPAVLLLTLIGYPVALCVFAFLIFVVVRAAMRSALREHRQALVEEFARLRPALATPPDPIADQVIVDSPGTSSLPLRETGTSTAAA